MMTRVGSAFPRLLQNTIYVEVDVPQKNNQTLYYIMLDGTVITSSSEPVSQPV